VGSFCPVYAFPIFLNFNFFKFKKFLPPPPPPPPPQPHDGGGGQQGGGGGGPPPPQQLNLKFWKSSKKNITNQQVLPPPPPPPKRKALFIPICDNEINNETIKYRVNEEIEKQEIKFSDRLVLLDIVLFI